MSGTKVSIKYGFGKPQTGSLKKAELAIDLKDLSLWTAESDGSEPVRVGHDTTEIEGEIDQINIDIQGNANAIIELDKEIQVNADAIFELSKDVELNAGAIDQLDKDAVKKNVASLQEMIGNLKALGFIGDGSGLTGITAGQLDDVDTSAAKRDDFLIYNGTNWVAEDFHIDTELTYQGGIALSSPAPVGPANGDLYINNTDGVVHPSWTGIAGQTVKAGNVVGWAATKSRWFLLGDIASSSITDVEGGLGISVDDTKPAEPIVFIDRVETDKWYEPKFSKNTAFNKAFGTASGQVAQGNHLHTGVYQPVGDYALKSYSYSKAESDGKYQLKGNYALVGSSYTKAESDGRYATKTYAYSKAESDGRYVPFSGNSTITGIITCNDLTITSDERYKGSIETLNGQKVYDMRGVSYTHLETGDKSSGVIAQELQQVAPELVLENPEGYLSVAYQKLAGYLIEAIKSQKEEIDELRQVIEGMSR